MGPSEFYRFVPNTTRDLFPDPMAVDLAAPTTMHVAAPRNVQHLRGSTTLESNHREMEASLQERKAAGEEGDSSSNEDYCESDAEEEYLAELEAALIESEPAEEYSPSFPPRMH